MLKTAEHTIYENQQGAYKNKNEWQTKLKESTLRIQWDPDHTPKGGKVQSRRAVQIGIAGYPDFISGCAILNITDITAKVKEGKAHIADEEFLETPKERPYVITDPELRRHLCLDSVAKVKVDDVDVEEMYKQAVAENEKADG